MSDLGVNVDGEEQYVVTLAEMLLAIKKQLDRIELILEVASKPQFKVK